MNTWISSHCQGCDHANEYKSEICHKDNCMDRPSRPNYKKEANDNESNSNEKI